MTSKRSNLCNFLFISFLLFIFILPNMKLGAQCRDKYIKTKSPENRMTIVRRIRMKNQRLMLLGKHLGTIPKFLNTKKPNAVVILPTYDPQEIYYSQNTINFIRILMKNYDTRIIVATNEQDVFDGLELIPDIELLFVGGAYLGIVETRKKSIMLSRKDEISYNDERFLCYLNHLDNDATIVLYTCFAGTGGKGKDNIANYIDSIIDERKIIAPRNNINACHIKVNEMYPLDISLMKNGKDMAYRVNF